MDPRWVLICLGGLLLSAGVPIGAASDGEAGQPTQYQVQLVSPRPVLGYDTDVWGDRVAWASPTDDAVEILVANLTTGNETVVTEIADPQGTLVVQSIAYDGRWIVWSDNRFGNFEVFAADTVNNTLSRLSHSSNKRETLPDVSEGLAVWLQGVNVTMANLETGKQQGYRERTAAAPPSINGLRVLWAGAEGANSTLYLDDLEGQAVDEIVKVRDGGIGRTDLAAERVAWIESHLVLDGNRVVDFANFTVETMSLENGTRGATPVRLDSVERAGAVATSNDWVAWKHNFEGRPGRLQMMYMPTNGFIPFRPAGTGGLSLSDEYLTFVGADNATANRTGGHVYTVELHPPLTRTTAQDDSMGTWIMVAGGAGLIGVGVFWTPIRRFVSRSLGRSP